MTREGVSSLKEADLRGKKVCVRVDLNVPLDDNFNITDDSGVRAAIQHLMSHGAKVILCSHLGRPKGVTPKFSLKPLVPRLSELLGVEVEIANDCIGGVVEKMVAEIPEEGFLVLEGMTNDWFGEEVEKMVAEISEGRVLLLQDVRFYNEEEKNGPVFGEELASLADLYVNDANKFAADANSKVGNPKNRNSGLPRLNPCLDPSVGDTDVNTFQVIKNEDLLLLKKLGSGGYGTVYHGKWRGTDVAIKKFHRSSFPTSSSELEKTRVESWHEADILSKLHHPNVVAFHGVVQDGPGGALATVMEYMVHGSLRRALVHQPRVLDHRKRLIIATDAALGMEYLHSERIVHFDLKCDNLLVNLEDPSRPVCKVGDFGLSKIRRQTLVSGGWRGTLPWTAPELLSGSGKVSEKVDVYSFGIALWEILTGKQPYANLPCEGTIIGGILANTLRPEIPNSCDPEWRDLMVECWAQNPAARPSFGEIVRRLRVMIERG